MCLSPLGFPVTILESGGSSVWNDDGTIISPVNLSRDLTFDGDMTIDTNLLYIDSGANRVGINTLTPSNDLEVTIGGTFGIETINMLGTGTLNNLDAIDATTTTTLEAALNHDNLTGFVAAEHIDWTDTTNDLSTTGNAIIGSELTVQGQINANGGLVITGDGTLNIAGNVSISDQLTVANFITEDVSLLILPLSFDWSQSNGAGTTQEYLVQYVAPYDMQVEQARLTIDLTPNNTITVALFEDTTDITTTDLTVGSATKIGINQSVDTFVESGNLLLAKAVGFSDFSDVTSTGYLYVEFERRSKQ